MRICARSAQGRETRKPRGVAAENKLNQIYGKKYELNLDHQILTGHGIFYPQALFNDLKFQITLAQAAQVVRGSDATKLKYRLANIELQYEIIESQTLAAEAESVLSSGKEFAYDHVMEADLIPIDRGSDKNFSIKLHDQRRSLKAILLLFVEGYAAGGRDSEKYVFPDLTKVSVTVNGVPNRLFNNGVEERDMWKMASRFFVRDKNKIENMNLTKFYTEDKFGLLIDMRSVAPQEIHGSGKRLVNSTDGVHLKIERDAKGSGVVNCHVFVISDAQFNIMGRQLESVQY